MKKVIMGMGLMLAASQVAALDTSSIYYGGGFASNTADVNLLIETAEVDGNGLQFFGGLPLDYQLGGASTAVEFGYTDFGDMDGHRTVFGPVKVIGADGIWVNGVASWAVGGAGKVVGRIGMDFGDADGLMFGVGYGHSINDNFDVRAEYVSRDGGDIIDGMTSLQLNVVYRP